MAEVTFCKYYWPEISEIPFCFNHSLHKKWSFPPRIFSVNVNKSAVFCGFGHYFGPYWIVFCSFYCKTQGNIGIKRDRDTMCLFVVYSNQIVIENICSSRNLQVDGCPSQGNRFGQSALLMNATYIVFS